MTMIFKYNIVLTSLKIVLKFPFSARENTVDRLEFYAKLLSAAKQYRDSCSRVLSIPGTSPRIGFAVRAARDHGFHANPNVDDPIVFVIMNMTDEPIGGLRFVEFLAKIEAAWQAIQEAHQE